jgi:hypothetical protein
MPSLIRLHPFQNQCDGNHPEFTSPPPSFAGQSRQPRTYTGGRHKHPQAAIDCLLSSDPFRLPTLRRLHGLRLSLKQSTLSTSLEASSLIEFGDVERAPASSHARAFRNRLISPSFSRFRSGRSERSSPCPDSGCVVTCGDSSSA